MVSQIDPTMPQATNATTASVRNNFSHARTEILTLQGQVAALEVTGGLPGPTGPPGAAATITVGTTTTGAPGTTAGVINVGTSNAAVFNFTIPEGQPGTGGSGGLSVVTANTPLTGDGTTTTPLGLAVATAAQVTTGTDNVNPLTSARLRQIIGADIAGLATTNKTGVIPAINELQAEIGALTSGLQFVGTYDVTGNNVIPAVGSPAVTGPLPAAAAANDGWFFTVSTAGTGTANAPAVAMTVGDWVLSNGTSWTHVPQGMGAVAASAVSINAIAGLSANNVQTGLEQIRAGALPVGTDLALQYNNNGAFGGLGITASPDLNSLTVPGRVIVNRSGVAIGANTGAPPYGASVFEAQGAANDAVAIKLTAFNTLPVLWVGRAQGTPALPTPPTGNTNLFTIRSSGFDGANFSTGSIGITFVCEGAQAPTTQPTRIDFFTTPATGAPNQEANMTLRNGLYIGRGGFAGVDVANDKGEGTITVKNGVYWGTGSVAVPGIIFDSVVGGLAFYSGGITSERRATVVQGVTVGPALTDMGVGTINVSSGFYINDVPFTGGGGGPSVDTVANAVADQTTPPQLTAKVNVVTGDGGVRLPTAVLGEHCFVRNDGSNPIEILPATGARINNRGADEAADLIANSTMFLKAVSATRWVTVP